MSFYARIALTSLLLALLTALVIWRGPQARDVAVVARFPGGEGVATTAPIRVIFSRAVDRLSVERNFVITPPIQGDFFWEGQTLTFEPQRPLEGDTNYRVTLQAGLQDAQGRPNTEAISWFFHTLSPRLLLVSRAESAAATLWIMAPDGRDARQVFEAPQGVEALALAPDGRQAIYVAPRNNPTRTVLLLLNLETFTTRPLFDIPTSSVRAPAWSPIGDMIAFERWEHATADQTQIWLSQPDGTLLGPLYGGAEQSRAPTWAPEGQRLAFIDGTTQTVALYTFTSIQQHLPGTSSEPPSWSADGKSLLYVVETDAPASAQQPVSSHIVRYDIDSTKTYTLTDGSALDRYPRWSPDGQWIAYVRGTDQGRHNSLWIMRSDGSTAHGIISLTAEEILQLTWSPDSQHLLYRSQSTDNRSDYRAVVIDQNGNSLLIRENIVHAAWIP